MKLYYHPLSTYSQKTLIALYEKGASFEREIIDLTSAEKRAEFKKFYPLGKVPVLVDGDKFIPESSIIIEYLEGAIAGGTRLIPEDRETARKVRFHDRTNDLYLDEPAVNVLFERDVAKAKETLDVTYRFLDKHLDKRSWLVGETFTMADCAAAPALGYLRQVYPFATFSNVDAYWNRIAERTSVRRALDEAKPYLHHVIK
ncbi:MAG TPA: glutathione S-transferase family protein [Labilithrix sp.]